MSRLVKSVCLVCPLMISFNASAEGKPFYDGFYAGGSLGFSNIDAPIGPSDVDAAFAANGVTTTTEVDDNGLGWRLFGGYNLNKYLGFEIAYVDLNELETETTSSSPFVSTTNVAAEVDGFTFAGIGKYPVTETFNIFGKVGAFVWDVEGAASVTIGGTTLAIPASLSSLLDNDGTDIMFGFGADFELMENVGIRAEWERYEVDNTDIDLVSIGVEYRF